MTQQATMNSFGVLTQPATLTIQRLLPGPIEQVWAYLTVEDLRRQWLAAGDMPMEVGATFELVWRNDTLTDPPGQRPDGFSEKESMRSQITELDPPRKLSITWGSTGGVTFTLEPQGSNVLLTVTHSQVKDRKTLLNVSAGWHIHLDILVARAAANSLPPFWEGWTRLKAEYDHRIPV